MKYEVNMCCDCAVPGYPCIGDACLMRHYPMYQCDRCGKYELEEDEIYHVDGEDLCEKCYEEEEEDND